MKIITILAVTGGLYLSSLHLNKPVNDHDLNAGAVTRHCTKSCCKSKCTKSSCKSNNNHTAAINPAADMLLQIAISTQRYIISWNPLA